MPDAAHKWTDKQLEALERRMSREYSRAAKEMKAKQEKHLASYARELEQREKALDGSAEAKRAHKKWLADQAAHNKSLDAMVSQLAERAVRANEEATAAAADILPTVYMENAYRTAYSIDSALGVDTMFTLFNEDAVRNLMVGSVLDLRHDAGKDLLWNKQKFRSAITQGILQGESVPSISRRIKEVLGMDKAAALRAARTATTGAENAGRVSSLKRAERLGIGVRQEWVATLDGRTRHSHRIVDGEQVKVGEKFSNGCRYPGDPDAPGSEVYNCRCSVIAAVEGVDTSDAQRWSKLPEGMTYEEWKSGKRSLDRFLKQPSVLRSMELRGLDEKQVRRLLAEEQLDMGIANKLFGSMERSEQLNIFQRVLRRFDGSAKAESGKHAAISDTKADKILEELFSKTNKTSIESCLEAVNPNYNMFGPAEYRRNCQRCVMAYEARRRGYDVEAMPRTLDGSDTLPYMRSKGGWPEVFKDGELVSCATDFGTSEAEVSKLLKDWGKGARAIVRVKWKDKESGHVFIAENVGDKIRYVDPQSGRGNVASYFSRCVRSETYCMRIDSLEFTDLVKECCREAK